MGFSMSYEDPKRKLTTEIHQVSLTGRSRLSLSGVEDVDSFDENAISLSTTEGYLTILGSDLHIEKLNLDGGELLVAGVVDSLTYEDDHPKQGGLFRRLFRS